jgi:hypothetical protein
MLVFQIEGVLPIFFNRNVIIFFHALICLDSKEKVISEYYGQEHC